MRTTLFAICVVAVPLKARADSVAPLQGSAISAATPTSASDGAETATEEVKVRGHQGSDYVIRPAESRELPGAFGDPFRAIEAMPGVVPIATGLPYFFVRGAPPGNAGYLVDGIRVPSLFHVLLGPATIPPTMLGSVDFYPGASPAAYGRFAGPVIAASLRPVPEKPTADVGVRLFDAGGTASVPFANGRGDIFAGARASFTGPLLSLFDPRVRFQYWDYQARADYALTPRDSVSILAFGSRDTIDHRTDASMPFSPYFGSEFHRVDIRYDRVEADGTRVRVAATLGRDLSSDTQADILDNSARVRMETMQPLKGTLTVRAGSDVTVDDYTLLSFTEPEGLVQRPAVFPSRTDMSAGVWGDMVWEIFPRVTITPGLRLDLYTSTVRGLDVEGRSLPPALANTANQGAVEPRFELRARATGAITYVASFGVSHQPPEFVVPVAALTLGRLDEGLQTALQTSQGVGFALPAGFTARASVFRTDFFDLSDLTTTCQNPFNFTGGTTPITKGQTDLVSPCVDGRVNGRAIGAELWIHRSLTKRLGGWLSYTLSRSTRDITNAYVPGNPNPIHEERTILSTFDRTHVLSLVASYDLGANWHVGARGFFYTGQPYSVTQYPMPGQPFNNLRAPAFFRIDGRLEKRWQLSHDAHVSLVFEWMNMTLSKEVTDVSCDAQGLNCTPVVEGPFSLPSVGVEAHF